jgi:hypothetical protein
MQITTGTEEEAERIVAKIWLALERGGLPSPKLTVTAQSPSLLIELQFQQQTHEELVRNELFPPKAVTRSPPQPEHAK